MYKNYYESNARVLDASGFFGLDVTIEGKVKEQLRGEDLKMVLKAIDLGRKQAKSVYVYNRDLDEIINNWTTAVLFQEMYTPKGNTARTKDDVNLLSSMRAKCIQYEKDVNNTMKTLIPSGYFIWALVFLAPAVLFGLFFIQSIFLNINIIDPMTSLIFFIGSFGMFLTVISAMHEWKKIGR